MIAIELPVPAYLYSYLTSKYGSNYVVNATDDLGLIILSVLKKKTIQYNYIPNNRDAKTYLIYLSFSAFEKHGCHISEQHISQINKLLDQNFRSNLFMYAIVNKEFFDIEYKKTINAILKFFNIEESELQYATIRKDFNRKKKKIEERLQKDNFYFFKK